MVDDLKKAKSLSEIHREIDQTVIGLCRGDMEKAKLHIPMWRKAIVRSMIKSGTYKPTNEPS